MDGPLDYANEFLRIHYDVDCTALFAPIDATRPQGDALRGTATWQAIRRAREADDASLPLGAWVKRLKRAQWNEVAGAACDALAARTKDLQLAVWLAEALLREHGFAGLAAGTVVIDGLCEHYWPVLYPAIAQGDVEHRANLLRWFGEKLLAPVRLAPLTACVPSSRTDETARAYTWDDCEQLRRQQQRAAGGEREEAAGEGADGVDAGEFAAALAATSNEALAGTHTALAQALGALTGLNATLGRCFEGDAPSLGALRDLLELIAAFVEAELRKRGCPIESEPRENGVARTSIRRGAAAGAQARKAPIDVGAPAAALAHGRSDEPLLPLSLPASTPAMRTRAYAQLAEVAATLAEIEPHSPVPYLIRKAVEWGALNTAQLYEELFIHGRGQLNVFELLGLGVPEAAGDAP
jgi:type VI secretion system protein ImpA